MNTRSLYKYCFQKGKTHFPFLLAEISGLWWFQGILSVGIEKKSDFYPELFFGFVCMYMRCHMQFGKDMRINCIYKYVDFRILKNICAYAESRSAYLHETA